MTARGCQDACTFCHVSKDKQERELYGDIGYLKLFSEERVAQDVIRAEKLGVTRLYFEDDNLFFNKKRLFKLAPHLQRSGMSYSDANGANLRFMVNKDNGKYTVDEDFIRMLSGFGMDELLLPFETRSNEMLQKYATGKFDPETMMPYEIVKSVKRNGISARSNFLIGFRDESWELSLIHI